MVFVADCESNKAVLNNEIRLNEKLRMPVA